MQIGVTHAALDTEKQFGGPGPPYAIIAMGGSAGGLQAVSAILSGLPLDFPSPILVVIHLPAGYTSHAAEILHRQTGLRVKEAEQDETIADGVVYVAQPNRHLLVVAGIIKLSDTPAVHFSRPAIDRTFGSVVNAYGSKVIGVVVSGSGRDGSEGLRAIKQAGGYAIVQDPLTARFPAMPTAASVLCADCVLPLDDIAPMLLKLSGSAQVSSVR